MREIVYEMKLYADHNILRHSIPNMNFMKGMTMGSFATVQFTYHQNKERANWYIS